MEIRYSKPDYNPFSEKWQVKITKPDNSEEIKEFADEKSAKDFFLIAQTPILTEEMKLNILKSWRDAPEDSPPSIKDLLDICGWGTRRTNSMEAKLIKEFLTSNNLETKSVEIKKIDLTDEQKEFIKTNYSNKTTPLEITKELFNNKFLTFASKECRAVSEYIKTIDYNLIYANSSEVKGLYEPPKTFEEAFKKLNECIHPKINHDKITDKEKANINNLISFLHSFRFMDQINRYERENERDLFENSFIKYVWDKPDLTQEDLDQYIILCTEVVISVNIQELISTLKHELDHLMNDNQRIPTNLVDMIGNTREEYNASIKRQKELYEGLTKKRSVRLNDRIQESASLISLIDYVKQEKTRKQMVKIAELKRKKVRDEVTRIENMQDLMIEIYGLDKEEMINGAV